MKQALLRRRPGRGMSVVAAHSVSIEGSPTLIGKALHVTPGGAILLGCENDGAIYRSTDDGHTFSLMQNLGAGIRVTWFLSLPSNTILCMVRTSGVIWNSTDDGLTWSSGTGPTGTYSREDAFVQLAGGRLVAGCHNGHAFTSDDSGGSWTDRGLISAGASVGYSLEVAANGNIVAGTNEAAGGQMYYSTDSGVTWLLATQPAGYPQTSTGTPDAMGSIFGIVLLASGTLLATGGISNNIWKSVDNGLIWTELAKGGATPASGGLNLIIYRVPSTGTLLTMGGSEGSVRVRHSTDDGVTWLALQSDAGINFVAERLLTTTGSENGRCFIETPGGAVMACLTGAQPVWRCETDGKSWQNPAT